MKKGDKVYYKLEQDRNIRWIPAVVLSIGPKRVTIEDDHFGLIRRVMPKNLSKTPK